MTNKIACITMDLESDHAGRVAERYDGWDMAYIHELFECLNRYRVPLSAFIVANSITKNTNVIRYMQLQHTEFFLHSYSHDLNHPDSHEEIRKGVEVYEKFFKKHPIGYRAPEGRISKAGYDVLHKNGFLFDSSVFPSFWPHPRYFFFPRSMHLGPYNMPEIPITTITPFRIIFSLSWVKLIGWRLYKVLLDLFPPPRVVVFDFHLHDLRTLPSVDSLSLFWRYIYRRNHANQISLLGEILDYLQEKGYTFVPIRSLILNHNI